MPNILIRDIPEETLERLKKLAKNHNRSLQMELKDIMLIIFKPNSLSKKGISRKNRSRTYIQQDKFEKRIGVKLTDDFIYLTDQNSPFILPLYEHFEFIKEVENDFIFIFRLQMGKISDPIRNELNSLWTEEW